MINSTTSIFVFLLLGATASAQVSPGAAASASFLTTTTEAGGYFFDSYNSSITPGMTSYSQKNVSATAKCNARIGEIQLLSSVTRTDNNFAKVRTAGGFEDRITISSAGREGQPGTLTGSVRLNFAQVEKIPLKDYSYQNIFYVAIWNSMANAKGSYPNGFAPYAGFYKNYDADPAPAGVNTDIPFTFGFIFGQPFDFGVWADSSISTGYIGGSFTGGDSGSIYHGATVTWNGKLIVQDSLGENLPSRAFSMTGTDGQNYERRIGTPSPTVNLSTAKKTLYETLLDLTTITVRLSQAAGKNLPIEFELTGSAIVGSDYNTSKQNQIVVQAGQTTASFTIRALRDSIMEPKENISVKLKYGLGYRLGNAESLTLNIPANL